MGVLVLELLLALLVLIGQILGGDQALGGTLEQALQNTPERRFAVLSTYEESGNYVRDDIVNACIVYATVGGPHTKCQPTGMGPLEGFDEAAIEHFKETLFCYFSARIGDPLPDCWR